MMTYIKGDFSLIYDIEALLYVEEVQLAKYHQELALNTATTNLTHTEENAGFKTTRGGFQQSGGQGNSSRGRGYGTTPSSYTLGNRPTYQLCGKYGHSMIDS